MGLTAGEPDLRIYWSGGHWGAIELKLWDGKLTPSQRARHPILVALGVPLEVVRARTPAEAVRLCTAILSRWTGCPAG